MRWALLGVSAALLAACGSSDGTSVSSDELPLPAGLAVVHSKPTPSVAGDDKINYLVVAGPANATATSLATALTLDLRQAGWGESDLADTRPYRDVITAESDDIFAVLSKHPCSKRFDAAPPTSVAAADDLAQNGRPSICVTLAPQ